MDVQEKTIADSVAISLDIMCLSCSAPIVMNFDTMVGSVNRLDEGHLDLCHQNTIDTALTST